MKLLIIFSIFFYQSSPKINVLEIVDSKQNRITTIYSNFKNEIYYTNPNLKIKKIEIFPSKIKIRHDKKLLKLTIFPEYHLGIIEIKITSQEGQVFVSKVQCVYSQLLKSIEIKKVNHNIFLLEFIVDINQKNISPDEINFYANYVYIHKKNDKNERVKLKLKKTNLYEFEIDSLENHKLSLGNYYYKNYKNIKKEICFVPVWEWVNNDWVKL
jgi:hypothetical protein